MTSRSTAALVGGLGFIVAGWGVAFATGAVKPTPLSRGAASSGRPAGSAASGEPALAHGTKLPAAEIDRLRERLGPFRTLLVVKTANGERSASTAHYLDVLQASYGRSAVAYAYADSANRGADSAVLRVVRLADAAAGTRQLDSAGNVVFASNAEATPDLARLLVEREVRGRTESVFAGVPTSTDVWQQRLAKPLVPWKGLKSGAGQLLASADQLVVFEAHCSECRIRSDLRILKELAVSTQGMPSPKIVAIFPRHYAESSVRELLDSLSLPILIADSTLSPELAYVSRDVPAGRPVVLTMSAGRVTAVRQAAEDR